MAFTSDYWHALDKQSATNLDVSARDIGISHGAGDVLDGLQSNIRAGAGAVELGFTGTGKGSLSGNQTTPEMFGKDKREAMRQLSKVNEVTLSTHATVGAQGLSGLDPRENAFTPQAAENTIHEIERTVDFAADVAGGGPVVIHGAEFPREVSEKYPQFEMYEGEARRTPVYIVNKRTGKIEGSLTKDTKLPIIDRDKEGNPKFDKEKNRYEVRMVDFGEFQKEKVKDNPELKDSQKAAVAFYKENIAAKELNRVDFEERRYRHDYERIIQEYEYLQEAKKSITDLQKVNPSLAKFQAIQLVKESHGAPAEKSEKYLDFLEDPFKYLETTVTSAKHHVQYAEDAAKSFAQQRALVEQQMNEIQSLEDYGKKASAKNLARAATYAYDTEKEMHLKKPLFIAPENLFPETGYGSHPRELKEVIVDARKVMTENLVKRGMSEAEAKNVAADHIKATFDIGHAYTWKKYFKRNEGESRDEYDKRFNKWVTKEAGKLADEKILGHVHISDNFGYYDEHLTAGQGSAPIKDFLKKIKDADIGPMIAEPGAQAQDQLHSAMTGAWGALAKSPVYRSERWVNIEEGYFGMTRSPYSIVGKYAPSEEYRGVEKGAPFWSGVGLE